MSNGTDPGDPPVEGTRVTVDEEGKETFTLKCTGSKKQQMKVKTIPNSKLMIHVDTGFGSVFDAELKKGDWGLKIFEP